MHAPMNSEPSTWFSRLLSQEKARSTLFQPGFWLYHLRWFLAEK
jgi:hypothetical protein